MRNWLFLGLLGVGLMSLALVVRFGVINFDRAEEREREMAIAADFPGSFKSISGLHFVVRRRGGGAQPFPGSEVEFRYTARIFRGAEIERREEPVRARVGQPPMLKGLTEALLGMRAGELRTVILPPQLAYGIVGKPPEIPPKATLIFEIELLAVR